MRYHFIIFRCITNGLLSIRLNSCRKTSRKTLRLSFCIHIYCKIQIDGLLHVSTVSRRMWKWTLCNTDLCIGNPHPASEWDENNVLGLSDENDDFSSHALFQRAVKSFRIEWNFPSTSTPNFQRNANKNHVIHFTATCCLAIWCHHSAVSNSKTVRRTSRCGKSSGNFHGDDVNTIE